MSVARRAAAATALLLVGLTAASASAATTLDAPDRVSAAGVVALRAHVDPAADPTSLTLRGPGDAKAVEVATNAGSNEVLTGGDLAFDLDTRCARYPAGKACSSPVVARNGVWTVALSGGQTATRDVVIAVPAATPRGVSATGTSPTLLTVSWARGAEPDVTWSVLEGRTVLVADLTPADACDDKGRCSATFSYPADADRSRTVVVRADRACPSCGGAALAPADSDPATATLPDAPAPSSSPSAGPSASGGPSARPGSSGAPGTGTADRGGIEKAIGTFVRPPSTIRLPAAPRASTAAVPAAAGQPDTFGKTLNYGDQSRTVVEKDGAPVLTQVGNALSSVGGALDAERAWKAGAGALLLIMVGVHLRVWLAAPGRG